jgi:hypothetical protein
MSDNYFHGALTGLDNHRIDNPGRHHAYGVVCPRLLYLAPPGVSKESIAVCVKCVQWSAASGLTTFRPVQHLLISLIILSSLNSE